MNNKILRINPKDNVAVALTPLKKGEKINIDSRVVRISENIPGGHKMALNNLKKGDRVIKYGFPIGKTTSPIEIGEWVHTHNLKTALKGKKDYRYQPDAVQSSGKDITHDIPCFYGYERHNGQVGIRNEIWVIPTVGCINKAVEKLTVLTKDKFKGKIDKGVIDGFYTYTHPYGCSQLGDDLVNTQKILRGLVKHPNAGAVLVVGLGCENNGIEDFKKVLGKYDENRVKFLNLQEIEEDFQETLVLLEELVNYAAGFNPTKVPVSKLKIGLKCGGSDSFSGITANPLTGRISDKLIACGGTSILSEVPEMFGTETILMERADSEITFNKIVELINGFKEYFISNGQEVYENPSPGNKEGGITTLEEKSLGNIQKGGTGVIKGVSFYGEQVKGDGLHLLESPGNDLVSTTALTAAGAQLILFTTGRGTPFGAPVPTIKIATNSQLARKKKHWIDFNAGRLIERVSMDDLADELFKYIIKVASKEKLTRNEINGYREIAIFKNGVTL